MKNYYLGLDIGTDSVGYALTDMEYNLLKYNGRPAWGSHIFDPVSDNAARRNFRSGRRRLDRRQQRVQLVRELFADEISKKDPDFYMRLQASALFREDAGEPYSIFNDSNYTDKDYYDDYPTIHHLIVDLMNNKKEHDVRLVYLACAWLVAHRGHFLSNIDKEKLGDIKNFEIVYDEFLHFFSNNGNEKPWECDTYDELGEIIKRKTGVNAKYKSLVSLIYGSGKPSKEITDEFPYNRESILKLIAGGTCKLQDLFGKEEYGDKGSVCLGFDDDKMAAVMADIGDDYSLIECLRSLYDWSVLVDAIGDATTISESKVNVYNQHVKDLDFLKHIIRKYKREKYSEVFRDFRADNYVAYAYHADGSKNGLKKAGKEEFSKYILSVVDDIDPDASDAEQFDDMICRLESGSFMPKQRNTDNRVIPYQLYWFEFVSILENASHYLPFLNTRDSDGVSVKEKIESIFLFKIPYYVGPLNGNSQYAWLERSQEKIYPWNFEKVVDLDRSEQNFIKRMTGTCTYLPGEHVLPKDSLCYHKYMVLNEINNLRINGQRISVELKQRIYNELFMCVKKVTRKRLSDYLISNGYIEKGEENSVTGIDIEINSNLAPQIAFKRLVENGVLSENDVERIIERASYAEDKSRLIRFLDKEYSGLSSEDKKYITGIRIKDFGRLSRRFLTEIEGICKETGEVMTIMTALWNTPDNLMELLSDKYTFKEEIENITRLYYDEHGMTLADRLNEMYISSSVKRSIYRTMDVLGDVVKAFGKPAKIFIETTRGSSDEKKGKRSKSRKQQILDLYNLCRDEDVKILKQQLEAMGDYADNKLQSEKLFLYYTQFGKCMYTGKPIELEKLGSKEYDIDHIYPQAYVKDDSIINNKVLVLSEENGKKSDTYPISESIRRKQTEFWRYLKDCRAISEEKYSRLTRRTPFSDEEKYGFINRQLVETSQSTKAVATILKDRFPETEIVYCKAGIVADFRHEFDLFKSRSYNDLHHAVDAYLNIVVGNVYSMKFTRKWFSVNTSYSVRTKAIFTHSLVVNGQNVWNGESMLSKVKKIAIRNDAHFTKYSFFKTGGLFDQMPLLAANGLIPRKKNLPAEKYGGYNKSSVMFFIPVKYTTGRKKDVMIMSVELSVGSRFLEDDTYAEEYANKRLSKILGKTVTDVCFPLGKRPLKINTVLSLDGFRVCITGGASGGKGMIVQPIVQFDSDKEWVKYTKRMERLVEKVKKNPHYMYSKEYDIVAKDKNIELYDVFISKLNDTIYRLRPNNPVHILESGRERFKELDVISQAVCLLNIFGIMGRMTQGCDLRNIGGAGKAAATVNFSTNISNWAKNYKSVRIIDSSASGIWEKKSENLLELL